MMQTRSLIVLGFIFGLAVGILGIIWRPYGDTGLSASSTDHFFALAATALSVMLPFMHAARARSRAKSKSTYFQIIASYFLTCSAVITLGLLFTTYMGHGYTLFWTVEIVQIVLLVSLMFCADHIGLGSDAAQVDKDLIRRRKESAMHELQTLRRQYADERGPTHVSILKAADALLEEFQYIPLHGLAGDAGLFGRTVKWRMEADNFLKKLDSQKDPVTENSSPNQLLAEASSITRVLATWKRQ